MPDTETLPLIAPCRERTLGDALLFRSLSQNPNAILIISRPGRNSRIIRPRGRQFGFYGPCNIIEVDSRERRIECVIRAESHDTGHFFQVMAQIVYRVGAPERVAQEVADPAGEVEQALVLAARRIAGLLHIEQSGTLRESLEELLRPQHGSLAERALVAGLEIVRSDLVVMLGQEERVLADLRRERSIHWSGEVARADDHSNFMIQIGGTYRIRTKDEADRIAMVEAFLANVLNRTSQGLIETIPAATAQQLSEAIGEALRRDLVIQAELASVGIELIRVAATVKQAKPKPASAQTLEVDQVLFEKLFPLQERAIGETVDDGPPLPDWLRIG